MTTLFLLACCLPSHAQAPADTSRDELSFQHVTTADGLSDNAVTCLFEDREGYIWIGTEHGLNKYDGQRMVPYTGSAAPAGMRISSIAQDSSGTIWATSTDGGLSRYDPATDRFSGFMHVGDAGGTLPTDRMNHLLALNDSILVIATQNACLLWCNTKARTYREHKYNISDTAITDTSGRWCHSTLRIDKGRIWLGLIPGGNSLILDARNGNVLHDVRSTHADSLHSLTNAILYKGEIIAGGWGQGITRIPLDRWGRQEYAPLGDEVTAIVPWTNGSLLVGTKINGLIQLDNDLQVVVRIRHHRNDPASLGDNRVRCLLKDRNGNIWAGTAGGLSVHAPKVWSMAVKELFPENGGEQPDLTFHNLQQDPDGTIRISTSHGFFTLKDPQAAPRHIVLTHEGRDLELTGLFRTGPNENFVGTETGLFPYDPGQERLDPTSGHPAYSRYPEIRMFQIRSVFADTVRHKRQILVGALGFGISVLDPPTLQYAMVDFKLVKDPSLALTHCTVYDSTTRYYWSGTPKGLYRWTSHHGAPVDTPLTFMRKSPVDRRLPAEDVSAIAIRGGTTWATLREGALVAITNGKVKAFMVPKHMTGDLQGLALDANGRVWCTTSQGMLRFDPKEDSWMHVPVNDGSRFRQLNRCILQLRDGTMALCADNCLITFDPAAFDQLPALPHPRIAGVRNAWGPIAPDGEGHFTLPYRASSFEADLSALWPTGPAPLEFLYRLDDIEPVPHLTTAGAPVRYAGVPAGDHRLLVRVRDAYGREGPELAVLTLSIAAPLWQRWWAYVLLVALAGGAMYAWSRYRFRQRMQMQAVRDGIARDLHDDIGSTLGSISYYSEALKRRLPPGDTTAKEVAEKIGANSREMIDRMSDIVWSVDPKNDDVGSLLERMKAHAGDLLAARGIALRFHTGQRLNDRHLNTPCRRALFLIFKEALHNAVKYAECSTVDISLHARDRSIAMEVADDGKGFDPENTDSYNGNGLPGIMTRAKNLGGTVVVHSSPGNGTRIKVVLPTDEAIPLNGD